MRWTDDMAPAAWDGAANQWVTERLAAAGRRRTAEPPSIRRRPWATLVTLPTDGGPVFLKLCSRPTAFEPRLTDYLAVQHPALLPLMLGVDFRRRLLLLDGAGVPLRECLAEVDYIALLSQALRDYAVLQRAAAARRDRLLADGVADWRPRRLPALLAAVLEESSWWAGGHPDGLVDEERRRLATLLPALERHCAALADCGLPDTVDHGDFHDGNILLQGDRLRTIDWGDAALGHPFTSLLVAARMAAYRLGCERNDPRLLKLRDAYLEPWTDVAPRPALLAAAALAVRVAPVMRVLVYRRAIPAGHPEVAAYDGVTGWLRETARSLAGPEKTPPG